MAVRSGAGTGVVVALVVFVLTTIFLLVLTIVFYSGQVKANDALAVNQAELDDYATSAQRSQEPLTSYRERAGNSNQSVILYLHQMLQDQMDAAYGRRDASLEQFQTEVANRFGSSDQSLFDIARSLQGSLGQAESRINTLEGTVNDRTQEVDELNATIEQLRQSHRDALARVQGQVDTYAQMVDDYGQDVATAIANMNQSIAGLETRYEGEIDDLENEKDEISRNMRIIEGRLEELQAIMNQVRQKAENPAMLVDGQVIRVGTEGEVYIDRGRRDRIVAGMSFEVYDDYSAIRVDPVTGEVPRGKASIRITKVGDASSTAILTRATPGRPVVRSDVIANAVYDPSYTFKFLVHGKFDVDGDGRPTEAEAEYLRSLVINWGGGVVEGSQIPGDLDFLVLGTPPIEPPPLGANPTSEELEVWVRRKQLVEDYETLQEQARQAQIPTLNANRFLILIGYTNR